MNPVAYIEETLHNDIDTLQSFPKYFLIEPINVCNARCIMCGIDFDSKQKSVMSEELFCKIIDEIAAHGDFVEKVMLYLDCEPLMAKHIAAKVAQAKAAGIKNVNIASNASILSEKRIHELLDAGLDEIYITIDSMVPAVYEKIRVGLKFEKVLANTLNFIRLRDERKHPCRIRVQMVQQELNFTEDVDFERYWSPKLRPKDQVVVQKAHNWGSQAEVMRFGDEEAVNDIPCIAIWGTMAIHVDGTVGLCCMDTHVKVPIGNVADNSIAGVWQGAAISKVRRDHLEKRRKDISICNQCTLWRPSKNSVHKL